MHPSNERKWHTYLLTLRLLPFGSDTEPLPAAPYSTPTALHCHNGFVPPRTEVQRWVEGYEAAWRSSGTDRLLELFTEGATYLHSPYADPFIGLPAIAEMWEADREGADEVFSIETEIVAVEEDTAVVRACVSYGDPLRQEYRDLWVLRFDETGRCVWFEEWAYWPERSWSARD